MRMGVLAVCATLCVATTAHGSGFRCQFDESCVGDDCQATRAEVVAFGDKTGLPEPWPLMMMNVLVMASGNTGLSGDPFPERFRPLFEAEIGALPEDPIGVFVGAMNQPSDGPWSVVFTLGAPSPREVQSLHISVDGTGELRQKRVRLFRAVETVLKGTCDEIGS